MLATWVPHYLTWPWWPDLDAYAALAQGWAAGIRPYGDVAVFNFPGQIELFWLLGTSLGWGRTAPIYAVDAALLIVLGLVLSAWSHKTFGRASAGLVGFIAVLYYYLGLDYALVAQRDWQGPVLTMIGLLLMQAWPGRAARMGSGVLLGAAFMIRPHVLLFAPPLALALVLSTTTDEPRRAWRALGEWGTAAAVPVLMGFAPVLLQGLAGDFVRGVRHASYGHYGELTPAVLLHKLTSPLAEPRLAAGALLAALAAFIFPARLRHVGWAWVLMLVSAWLYRPFHPRAHAYLWHPFWLVWSINLGMISGAAMIALGRRPGLALGAMVLLVALASPGIPRFCNVVASLTALSDLSRGVEPAIAPPGAAGHFSPDDTNSPYAWQQYHEVLAYLRRRTSPRTRVANLLRNVPFPAVNGPVGRISCLPGESGLIWVWSVDAAREADFAQALEVADDAVVVWVPGEKSFDPRLQVESLERTVRQFYRPEARMGTMEIWRRIPRLR
jgi:hypothetical protein